MSVGPLWWTNQRMVIVKLWVILLVLLKRLYGFKGLESKTQIESKNRQNNTNLRYGNGLIDVIFSHRQNESNKQRLHLVSHKVKHQ